MKAIVTGAARGIGAVIASGLMREGWRVACLDLRDEPGLAVAGAGDGRYLHCDVSDSAAVDAAFAQAVAWLGGLDLLVAAAGLDKPGFTP